MTPTESFNIIRELLQQRADANARLALIPYEGTPEVKTQSGQRYLYMRKRVAGKLTSTYVGPYEETLHQLLLRNATEARKLHKQIRNINRQLAKLGYAENELAPDVVANLDFARANMAANIYDQAVLEGVAASFPQAAEIINNGQVSGMSASDVQKVLNLKHAWEFVLDPDMLRFPTTFPLLSQIARLANEGFLRDGGRVRGTPVRIGGTSYVPPIPEEVAVSEQIADISLSNDEPIEVAIALCLYCMKTQVFLDGNKRASIIFANHYLIAHAGGLLVVPQDNVPLFKELLIAHYEGTGTDELTQFMQEKCWRKMK